MLPKTKCEKHNHIHSAYTTCYKCQSEGLDVKQARKTKVTYSEKLKDTRWQKKRLEVFEEARWRCEECLKHFPKEGLQVHHITYLTGVEPWNHPLDILMCLCAECHKTRQKAEQQFFCKVAQVIRHKSVEELMEMPVWYMFETKPLYEKDKK